MQTTKTKHSRILHAVYFYIILILLALARAVASYFFLIPNGFAPGGVSGLATIIYKAVQFYNPMLAETWLNPAVTVFVINLPIVGAAFFHLDKKLAFNTALVVAFYSAFMGLFSLLSLPVFQAEGLDSAVTFLAAITGGVIAGIGLGFMLMKNMSMGGTDIIGKFISRKNPAIDVQWAIFAVDVIIVLMSGGLGLLGLAGDENSTDIMVRILSPIFYSFISLFVTSQIAEVITGGIQHSRVFTIFTDLPTELGEAITQKTGRGVSVLDAEGFYTHNHHRMLVTVVYKKQAVQVKRIIKQLDPNAFFYIGKVNEVRGQGFKPTIEDDE